MGEATDADPAKGARSRTPGPQVPAATAGDLERGLTPSAPGEFGHDSRPDATSGTDEGSNATSAPPTPGTHGHDGGSERDRNSSHCLARPAALTLTLAALAGALLWVSLAAWAMSSPPGSSPDEDYHVAMIYCAAQRADCIREGERTFPCFALKPETTGACLTPAELHATTPPTKGIRTDWYPPFYYRAMAPLASDTVTETVLRVRLANVTLAVLSIGASAALAGPLQRRAVGLAWLAPSVPLGMFLVASVNPSAWAIIGIAAMWGPLVASAGGGGPVSPRRRVVAGAWALVAAAIALAGRSETPVFVVAVAAAAVVLGLPLGKAAAGQSALVRWRAWLETVAAPLAVTALAGAFAVMWGTGKAGALAALTPVQAGLSDALRALWRLPAGALGLASPHSFPLGWLDTAVPVGAGAAAVTALALVVASGLVEWSWRKGLALAVLLATYAALVIYAVEGRGQGVQPRYVLPLLFAVVGVACWRPAAGPSQSTAAPSGSAERCGSDGTPDADQQVGLRDIPDLPTPPAIADDSDSDNPATPRPWARHATSVAVPAAAITLLAGANAASLAANIDRYLPHEFGSLPAWWWPGAPPSAMQLVVAGGIAFAASSIVAAAALTHSRLNWAPCGHGMPPGQVR